MPTGVSVDDFIAGIEMPRRRDECALMLELMGRATGLRPQMWGPSIIGYGRYAYTYDSGHSGQSTLTGFSPRKAAMVVYVVAGFAAFYGQLARLGPHTHSVFCLYLKRLDRVDEGILEEIVAKSVRAMKAKYPGWSPA